MHRFSRPSAQTSFRAARPLTAGEISYYAPSVLANEAHESRGERYTYIPTGDVLQALATHDFLPYEVRQTKVRDQNRREHTKHMVRLRHASADIRTGEVPEIILVNSHDGTSSYQIMAGFFRMVCSNGLIAGDINTDVRVRHSGNVVGDVIEGSFEVLHNLQEIERRKESYKSIELLPKEQLILAEEAVKLRWGEESAIDPRRLLYASRVADMPNTLWNTFNRVQENLIKGGVSGRSATGRRTTSRAVGGVNENVKLNRALWALTEKMAELKAA